MAPRAMPAEFADRVEPQTDLATDLAARDQAFFYSGFHIEDVR